MGAGCPDWADPERNILASIALSEGKPKMILFGQDSLAIAHNNLASILESRDLFVDAERHYNMSIARKSPGYLIMIMMR